MIDEGSTLAVAPSPYNLPTLPRAVLLRMTQEHLTKVPYVSDEDDEESFATTQRPMSKSRSFSDKNKKKKSVSWNDTAEVFYLSTTPLPPMWEESVAARRVSAPAAPILRLAASAAWKEKPTAARPRTSGSSSASGAKRSTKQAPLRWAPPPVLCSRYRLDKRKESAGKAIGNDERQRSLTAVALPANFIQTKASTIECAPRHYLPPISASSGRKCRPQT